MTRRGFLREDTGAAAVEFALVALLFFSMVLGIIDLARFAWEMLVRLQDGRARSRLPEGGSMSWLSENAPASTPTETNTSGARFPRGTSAPRRRWAPG